MVGRNITILLKIEYDHVRTEYGEIINASEISNGDDAIDDVWNEYNPQQVTDNRCVKHQKNLLTDDDINLSMSRIFLGILKRVFRTTNRNIILV